MTLSKELENRITASLVANLSLFDFKKGRTGYRKIVNKNLIQYISVGFAHVRNEPLRVNYAASIRFSDIENEYIKLREGLRFGSTSNDSVTIESHISGICIPKRPYARLHVIDTSSADAASAKIIEDTQLYILPWFQRNSILTNAYDWLNNKIKTEKFFFIMSPLLFTSYLIAKKLGVQPDFKVMVLISELSTKPDCNDAGYIVAQRVMEDYKKL